MRLVLPPTLAARVRAEAMAAFPRECCGLIEGARDADGWRATALHSARNLAGAGDRFLIDPAAQFELARALRGTDRAAIGCYHSHPNGAAMPSARDLAGAEAGQMWLIAALGDAGGPVTLAAFVAGAAAFAPLMLGETGADAGA